MQLSARPVLARAGVVSAASTGVLAGSIPTARPDAAAMMTFMQSSLPRRGPSERAGGGVPRSVVGGTSPTCPGAYAAEHGDLRSAAYRSFPTRCDHTSRIAGPAQYVP